MGATAAAEIASDESGNVLWIERYPFGAIHRVGDDFIRDYKEYIVISASFTPGKDGGVLVEHTVKLIADRTPSSANAKDGEG